jgi:hypothetical protein
MIFSIKREERGERERERRERERERENFKNEYNLEISALSIH